MMIIVSLDDQIVQSQYNHHLSMRRSIDPWWVFFPAELRSRATISARSLSPAVSGSITATWVPGPSGPGENDGNPIRSLESLGKSQEKCDHIHNIFFLIVNHLFDRIDRILGTWMGFSWAWRIQKQGLFGWFGRPHYCWNTMQQQREWKTIAT
jgi:hypothetical protein